MTFVITTPCIDTRDQSCIDVCPVDCIHFEEGLDRILYIDPVECIDCGACEPACPVDAIFTEEDVPADQQQYIEINVLWYQDKAAARAKLADVPTPDTAPAEGAAAKVAPAAAADEAEPAEEAVPMADTAPGALTQVEAVADIPQQGVIIPAYRQPSPLGLVALAGFAVSFFVMWVLPGPRWLSVSGVDLGAGLLLAILPAAGFLLLFLRSQFSDLAGHAAHHERSIDPWRDTSASWRRSEESRRFELIRTVQQLAEERFRFPSEEFPGYRTHVNLPEPSMALEFGGGASEKLFPDILVVEYPGNYPVIVAQVETQETLTREQAERVWSRLETKQAPLDLYVPAGQVALARDFARAAGLRHVRFRTWRHGPNGMTIREV